MRGQDSISAGVKFAVFIISLPLVVLLHGYTIQKLWEWFIVPHFALDALPFVTALGLGLLVSFLTSGMADYKSADDIEFSEKLAFTIAKPIVSLAVGFAYVMVLS